MKYKIAVIILLISGCTMRNPQYEKLLTNHEKFFVIIGEAHNKLLKCVVDSKDLKQVRPCLEATPTPTPTAK